MTEIKNASVVQCPACQTKFMVQAASLAGIDFPRFHCSRCDHVFTIELHDLRPLDAVTSTAQPSPPSEAPVVDMMVTGNAETISSGWEQNQSSAASEADTAGLSEFDAATSDPLEPIPDTALPEEIQSSTAAASNQPDLDATLELPVAPRRDFGADLRPEPVRDSAPGGTPLKITPPAMPSRNPTQISFDFSNPGRTAPLEHQSVDPTFAARGLSQMSRVLFSGSRWGSFFALSSPVVMTLALVIGTGYLLERRAPGDLSLAQSLFPHAPTTAPEELVIEQTRYRVVELNNGERVPVISGTIQNNSEREFREVIIEGLAFDGSGALVGSTKVSAAANLARAKIKSFDVPMIENLQRERESQLFRLKPGESQSFSFALLHMPVRSAHYFAARVYSVKE